MSCLNAGKCDLILIAIKSAQRIGQQGLFHEALVDAAHQGLAPIHSSTIEQEHCECIGNQAGRFTSMI